MENCIDIALDKDLYYQGINFYHSINFNQTPHIMSVGSSGSGKTFFNKLLIGKITKYVKNSSVTVLDFKADDYKFASNCHNLFEFEAVKDGLDQFYAEFLERQQGRDPSRIFKLLVIEEYVSMVSYFDKKTSEDIKAKLANLIFLGRSFNVHCLISTQRPDSSMFSNGVRDSINTIVAMGNLSKEGKSMLFSGFQDEMTAYNSTGSGYMLVNGAKLYSIKVPQVTNTKLLEDYICKALNR